MTRLGTTVNTTATAAASERHLPGLICGALSEDLSRAVDLLCTRHGISGSSAFKALTRGAEHTHQTVRETARMVVTSPDSIDHVLALVDADSTRTPQHPC
jgi:hypothetical protein